MTILFEAQTFKTKLKKPASWSDSVFQYCYFEDFDSEGADMGSHFIACTFDRCEWYWGHFNCAVLVGVKFNNCRFRGTGFSGCKFVECEFVDCSFELDNLNSPCRFEDIGWYGCSQLRCPGLEEQFRSRR
ncbi:MAG: pentapeptide repeat-containing protein [Massilia sp.]